MDTLNYPVRLDNPRAWRTYLGGSGLDRLHGTEPGEDGHFPEEWIMSVVAARNVGREDFPEEGMSHIPETGKTLKALIEANPEAALGKEFVREHGATPGVLVKLIDSAERLTLQVHPDRPTAERLFHSPYGKTECWHILEAREVNGEEPCIYYGFKEGMTKKKWQDLFNRQDIPGMLEAMQRFVVMPGDTILIEGGMPHAIGAGCFLVEIQEPTDFTVRVERTTPSGFPVADFLCHQGIGFEKMMEVFHYQNMTRGEIIRRGFLKPTVREYPGGKVLTLVGYNRIPYFQLNEIQTVGSITVQHTGTFSGLYVLEGNGTLKCGERNFPLEKTAQFFVPAGADDLRFSASPGEKLTILQFFGPQCQTEKL